MATQLLKKLWGTSVHYHVHNSPPSTPVLNHINRARNITAYILGIHWKDYYPFNYALVLKTMSSLTIWEQISYTVNVTYLVPVILIDSFLLIRSEPARLLPLSVIQTLFFWTLPIVLFLFKTHSVSETGFCLRLQITPAQLVPIDRASPNLRSGFHPQTETEFSLRKVVFK
jgi:hypothetical protein